MVKPALVCNTSPLLYLGRIALVQLLPALFDPVYVPETVILELDAGRLLRPDTIDPRGLKWITRVSISQTSVDSLPPNRLGSGERAVIAYASAQSGCVVGLDDRQARLLAQQLGLTVVGTIGILIKAKQAGLIPSVWPLLDAVHREGFHITTEVYSEALQLIGEVAEAG